MTTDTKPALEKHYRGAYQRALEAFGGLSDDDWSSSKRRGAWRAKDYLAHLVASQEQEGNPVTEQVLAGEKPVMEGHGGPQDINAYNARIIEEVRGLETEEILTRFQAAFEANLRMLEGLPDGDLSRTIEHPGWFRPGTMAQLFYTAYLHLPLHYQDIRGCLDPRPELPHWMDAAPADEAHHTLACTFEYMPVTYWAERGGDINVTFLFTLTGPAGGEWAVEVNGPECRSYEGRPERADLELIASPAAWVDLETKQLNPIWGFLTRRIKTKGNLLLALKLEQLFEAT